MSRFFLRRRRRLLLFLLLLSFPLYSRVLNTRTFVNRSPLVKAATKKEEEGESEKAEERKEEAVVEVICLDGSVRVSAFPILSIHMLTFAILMMVNSSRKITSLPSVVANI